MQQAVKLVTRNPHSPQTYLIDNEDEVRAVTRNTFTTKIDYAEI